MCQVLSLSTMVHVSLIHRVLRIMSRSRHVTCAIIDFTFPTVRSLSTTSYAERTVTSEFFWRDICEDIGRSSTR